MRAVTFASSSTGNCALVSGKNTNILIDAGISMKRIVACIDSRGLAPGDIDGVFITHEHSDHISGLSMLLKYYRLKVYAPRTVAARLCGMIPYMEDSLTVIHTLQPFELGELAVTAFHTPHDTDESVGYRFDGEGGSFGFCTDLGQVTDEVRGALCGVGGAVIESNHDEEMLRYGPYPAYLKRRILSDRGHLSNEMCGELAVFLAQNGAGELILGHISRENNTPEKALRSVRAALSRAGLSPAVFAAPPYGEAEIEVGSVCSA